LLLRRLLALVLTAALAVGVAAALSSLGGAAPDAPLVPGSGQLPGEGEEAVDPLAWDEDREDELVAAAARGHAHPLFTQVPGGARASAERVARWRGLVERTAAQADLDADALEALVYLESAGRPDAAADPELEGAVGLTQILAQTGRDLLGLRTDPAEARRLTRAIRRAERRGRAAAAERLRARRAEVDERFDPARALAATGRYLTIAREELGRDDLALVSYHMGIGNLQGVLEAYGEDDVSYAQLFFDSTPLHHAEAWRRLSGFADGSNTYLWRLEAAREVMRLWREDGVQLDRLAALHDAKASAEEVLHPPDATEAFAEPDDVADALGDGDLLALDPAQLGRLGLRISPDMGELAGRLGQEPELYRALRPAALATLLYTGAGVEAIAGPGPVTVTSTVRDRRYQRLLVDVNVEATRSYSLHTTGWSFDIRRRYHSAAHARAFQFLLDRLQAHDLIAWVREPGAIHVTVSERAEVLLGALER
jgi:hypothetical protein